MKYLLIILMLPLNSCGCHYLIKEFHTKRTHSIENTRNIVLNETLLFNLKNSNDEHYSVNLSIVILSNDIPLNKRIDLKDSSIVRTTVEYQSAWIGTWEPASLEFSGWVSVKKLNEKIIVLNREITIRDSILTNKKVFNGRKRFKL